HLSRALERDPRCLPALEGLERLARKKGNHDTAFALMSQRAALEEDTEARMALLWAQAREQAQLGRTAAARETLAAMGDGAPDEAIELRARLDEEAGDSAAAATAWTLLCTRARAHGDLSAEAAALAPLARLLEGPLGRADDAERARIRLCETSPHDVAA